ncbi:TetR/AcrR family transcriptional regulator [Bifidobacterium eulemuris]|uniref:AcrR family transcriptional regulator n=1 Tax=Bifidobacterium eulemuris TaxID=1765219 RepID=A0A261GCV6_9BIFI|nr:TetR/AcrR family transcriptional regulator [Bifidobacterium eulemuris]OZG69262.1 AcrR family transcriptional regulator [Bifidobacterium eulemuris]QOL31232.1 TetR/AcrR family transcriptional regulator [Bifidobacterium eulemuris]
MPRPRKDSGLPSAQERMEQAFWTLLERHPYSQISMKEVTRLAAVNHNTFYYHYSGLDELAESALQHAIPHELVAAVLRGFTGSDEALARLIDDPTLSDHMEHLCHAASERSSPHMRAMVRDAIRQTWFTVLDIDPQAMGPNSQLAVEAALGVFMAMFSYRAEHAADMTLVELLRADSASQLRIMLPNLVMSALVEDGAISQSMSHTAVEADRTAI